jgi:tetratricopeptide (TPR) repeat protein
MRWLQTEYILKGVYLGLLLDIALREAGTTTTNWSAPLILAACTLGGLVLALLAAAVLKVREGYGPHGRPLFFVLFLLMENPTLIYAGILAGTVLGAYLIVGGADRLLLQMIAGGAALGIVFGILRHVQDRRVRLGLSLALGAGLVAAAVYVFGLVPLPEGTQIRYKVENYTLFGVFLLTGLPIFYLLTFAGQQEESEVEVGAMCATLGLGLTLITQESQHFRLFSFGLPILLYFWYTLRVLPWLRVFKYFLRGITHLAVGRFRPALLNFRRVLHYDPKNASAREAYWQVHTAIDFTRLGDDPELLALVDFNLCVERAGSLLVEASPGANRLVEANRLLDLVMSQQPVMRPAVAYWRAVALTHERHYDQAAAELDWLLDPAQHDRKDPYRLPVLLPAWQLVLTLHDELKRRVGLPQLALPGRRMEAIAATERHLAENPDDQGVWALKRLLYQDLAEADFEASFVNGRPPVAFDYAYAAQSGQALIEDPTRWERGAAYLRMAARGLPEVAPTLHTQLSAAYERAGQHEEALHYLERARKVGQAVGHKNLPEGAKHDYFRALKQLGEEAVTRRDLDAALENYNLYAEYERSGIETLRTIAQLYEEKEDALAALRVTDRALQYNASDKDLLERRDRYYISVRPDVLKVNPEVAEKEFDAGYCERKARALLDYPEVDLEVLDWAEHLIDLALVVKPEDRPTRLLKGRARWRRGEVEEAAAILEGIRTPKPEKFASSEDEEAWFVSCQLLGDLYLNNLGKPDLAIACLNDFKTSPKSGAKTLYRLGQAYEQLGDTARAARFYEQVTAYEGNPLAYEAQDALDRVRS